MFKLNSLSQIIPLVRLGGLIFSVTNLYRLYHVEKKKVSHGVVEKSFKKSKRKDFYRLIYSHVANIRVI